MKKIAFKTLGCRLNLFETDALASQFAKNDYQVVEFNEDADVYVINTCTVTNQSDQKSRNAISQADRIKQWCTDHSHRLHGHQLQGKITAKRKNRLRG